MKLVSILGDSVSTFEGFNPPGYSVFYDKEVQTLNGLDSVYDTWWAKVNQALQAHLCVNNSYSGSRVTGNQFPAGWSEERINNLCSSEYDPDIILVYLGFNDFGYGVKLRNQSFLDPLCFSDAYDLMLKGLTKRYRSAAIICGTLMRTAVRGKYDWIFPETIYDIPFESYNSIIRRACKENSCYLADTGSMDIRYETLDGSHPTAEGHKAIANAWIRCLTDLNLCKPSIETCIKQYHADKTSDMAVYMVFSSLVHERVLMPFSDNDHILGIPYKGKELLAAFTMPDKADKDSQIRLRPVYLRDMIDTLIRLDRTIAINPFSSDNLQFIIPPLAIEKMLKPLADKE